jgi:hypothetical protein
MTDFKTVVAEVPQTIAASGKKVLTSKFRYVFIEAMRAQPAKLTQTAIRYIDGLSLRALNLLGLASLLALLILSRGAGTG